MRNNRERQAALEDEAFLAEELAALSDFTLVSDEVEWQPMNALQMSNMDWDGNSVVGRSAAPTKPATVPQAKASDFRPTEPARSARAVEPAREVRAVEPARSAREVRAVEPAREVRAVEPARSATTTIDPPAVDGFFSGFGWQAPGDLSDRVETPQAPPNLPPNQKPSPRAQADNDDAFSAFNWE